MEQPDLMSALPEDLLLQVLLRLRSARAAASTSLLSRRWRGLWIGLPDLIFVDVAVRSVQAALSSLMVDPGVSQLNIVFTSLQAAAAGPDPAELSLRDIHIRRHKQVVAAVPSLLNAAARVSPVEFRLVLPLSLVCADVDLPRFHRATSIELSACNLHLTLPRSCGGFPKLEKLSLSGCYVDLAALVRCCPCLRELSVSEVSLNAGINIKSDSLQKLSVWTNYMWTNYRWTYCINVEAPMLKELTLSFSTGAELTVSVVAPILEKVSWGCSYATTKAGLSPWALTNVSLHAAESRLGQRVITGEDTCLQLSNVYVLSLRISCCGWFHEELNFMQQIEKHLVTDFSVLELTMQYHGLGSVGHIFGPFVLHLLGMHRIRTATRRLQIYFLRSKVKEECTSNCPCDEPKNWRSKNISLINLEEVEIDGFEWKDHEFDFLKVIFRCAPMLKRMVVRTSDKVTTNSGRRKKIQDIYKAYPFVECKLMQR